MTTWRHFSLRVLMWLTHPTRTLITPCSQNNHCSWTSRLSPAHRAHHMQTVTYYNSYKTQQPRTTFWKTAREARTMGESHFSVLPLPLHLTPRPVPRNRVESARGEKTPMKWDTTWLLLRHHTSSLACCYVTRGDKCWSQTCNLQVCVFRLCGF